MSALSSARGGFEGAIVLDAFAGSGALGLESISRGAAFALFCERDRAALQALDANVEKLALGRERAFVRRSDVMKHPPTAVGRVFDLVFLDPPYAYDAADVLSMVEAVAESGALSSDAIVVYEHDRSRPLEENEAANQTLVRLGFATVSRKTYGDTTVDIMGRGYE